jgi:antibiotic biosynthesis monooxygenase (ABM) superfamily enzyme
MIARVWHGWTKPESADEYERLLQEEILPTIASKDIAGFEGGEVFRRPVGEEIEFMTVLWFGSMEGVRDFVGEEVRRAHVPEKAQRLLSRYEDRARHYERRFKA